MTLSNEELHGRVEWNCTNHAPKDPDIIARFEALREFAKTLSHAIIDLCPPGRDRDLSLELVESALMRGTASIARNQDAVLDLLDQYGDGRDPDGHPRATDFFDTVFGDDEGEVVAPTKPSDCICEIESADEGEYIIHFDPECTAHPPQVGKTEDAEALDQMAEAALVEPVKIAPDHDTSDEGCTCEMFFDPSCPNSRASRASGEEN